MKVYVICKYLNYDNNFWGIPKVFANKEDAENYVLKNKEGDFYYHIMEMDLE